MGSMLPQCGQSSSMEKREAETQCLQCQDVIAHTFMGRQTSSQGHTIPISNSLCTSSPQCTTQINSASSAQYSRAKGPPKASLCPTEPRKPRASQRLECVHMCMCEADSQSLHVYTQEHVCVCVSISSCVCKAWSV